MSLRAPVFVALVLAAPAVMAAPTAKPVAAHKTRAATKTTAKPTAVKAIATTTAAVTPTASTADETVLLRGTDEGLGRGSEQAPNQVVASRPADKAAEDRLVPRAAAAKAQVAVVAATPLSQLLDSLAAQVQKARPKGTGRVAISFSIGPDGRPKDVLVVSFDPKLDAALEATVTASSFTRGDAGDYLTYAMQFKAGKRLAR